MKNKYYVDSCIWLNIFKKEGDSTKGEPYWKIAEEFAEKYDIVVSTIVIKEVSLKLEKKFEYIIQIFKELKSIEIIKTISCDYDLARRFEFDENFKIGFYDYLHVAISIRLGIPLVTRDKDLIDFAEKHIDVYKPEDLIN